MVIGRAGTIHVALGDPVDCYDYTIKTDSWDDIRATTGASSSGAKISQTIMSRVGLDIPNQQREEGFLRVWVDLG
jgi:hypothetical protein